MKEIQSWLSCTHRGRGLNLQLILFLPGYITFRTSSEILIVTPSPVCRVHPAYGHASFLHAPPANSCGHSSSLPPTQCTLSRLLLACNSHKFSWSLLQLATYTMHVFTLSSCMPLTQILVVTPPAFQIHNARYHASFLHATHTINTAFLPRTPMSCLF